VEILSKKHDFGYCFVRAKIKRESDIDVPHREHLGEHLTKNYLTSTFFW
jgi:hypothetical protein